MRYLGVVCILMAFAIGALAQTCDPAPGAAAAAPSKASGPPPKHDAAVESLLQVARISVGSPAAGSSVPVQIQFRNRSPQAITGFEFRFRVQYPEEEALIDEGGKDFLKDKATTAQVDADSPIPPSGVYKLTREVPLGPDGAPPIYIEAYPVVVLLADRTAAGDPRRIAQIVDDRGAEAEDLADVISDLKRALASDDPGKALAARIAQLKKNGAQSGPYFKRAVALESYQKFARAGLQPHIDALAAHQKTLVEQSKVVPARRAR